MRIALVNPPGDYIISGEVPDGVKKGTGTLPPMGLLYLEASLASEADLETRIFDFSLTKENHINANKRISGFDPDILGVTGHTYNYIDMIEISKMFKSEKPDGIVIWGGSHASAFPDYSIKNKYVDVVAVGEGEALLPELVNQIRIDKNNLHKIDGILWKNKGEIIINGPRKIPENIDLLKRPRRNAVDYRLYSYGTGVKSIVTGMVSSRGCPFRCTFCSTPGTLFRCRSARNVVDEMQECRELGIDWIYFVDDTFNVDKKRVLDICREIIKRRLSIKWSFRGRIDLIDKEMLSMARDAGCARIHLGIETDTDEGLKILGKQLTVDKIKEAFKIIKSSGIESMAYFMIGCPHQKSIDDIMKTVELAVELSPDYALFGILTPYPGTELYMSAVDKGVINPEEWEQFLINPDKNFTPPIWSEYFRADELRDILKTVYRRFYQRPAYILKEMMKVKTPAELIKKAITGINILK